MTYELHQCHICGLQRMALPLFAMTMLFNKVFKGLKVGVPGCGQSWSLKPMSGTTCVPATAPDLKPTDLTSMGKLTLIKPSTLLLSALLKIIFQTVCTGKSLQKM